MLLKGSRNLQHRETLNSSALDGPEIYGPPVAIPFKWEEVPGKPKPEEETRPAILQMKQDHNFYNRLLTKEGEMGESSRRAPIGNVPFGWEQCPGTPKSSSAATVEEGLTLAPLSPPPCLQPNATPPHFQNQFVKGSFSKKLKDILHNRFSPPLSPKLQCIARYDGHARSNQSSCSADTEDSASSNSLVRSDSSSEFKGESKFSPNLKEETKTHFQQHLRVPAAKDSKGCTAEQQREEDDEESDFQDAVANFMTVLEIPKEDANGSCNAGDPRAVASADRHCLTFEADNTAKAPNQKHHKAGTAENIIFSSRMVQNFQKEKLKAPRHSMHRGCLTACLPICSFASRRPKVYEDYQANSD